MPGAPEESRSPIPKEGRVADKPSTLIPGALSRAAAAPDGLPLFGKAGVALFPSNQIGKLAAQRCRDEGWLDVSSPPPEPPTLEGGVAVAVRKKSKTTQETAFITESGLEWLLAQTSPRPVLEDIVRVLEARRGQAAEALEAARRLQVGFDALRAVAEKALDRVGPCPAETATTRFLRFRGETPPDVETPLLARLESWRASGAPEDCPLPDLFRSVRAAVPAASVGAFHDALRRLHETGRVYLHPWTGPLYDLPEPPYALLVGHEVAYYASLRQG
jgi:hypothetical protein